MSLCSTPSQHQGAAQPISVAGWLAAMLQAQCSKHFRISLTSSAKPPSCSVPLPPLLLLSHWNNWVSETKLAGLNTTIANAGPISDAVRLHVPS